ncbi:MAG: DUF4230 domain-containing protein [Saprospiraceae bacterium]|nr:DUF4230 domain-containing protein [Saprospiraceae bacterium]
MVRYIIYAAVVLLLILTGWYIGSKQFLFKAQKSENATVMLEKIKTVTKLIAVEGNFTELYDYKENYNYDFFNLFSKKALLRVTAKVSVGYDFEKVNITIDSIDKKLVLNEFPTPEILSIDHDLDYYDITQGTFNKFTNEEYNLINKKAKQFIAEKANTSALFKTAEEQKKDYILMMDMALRSMGWKLVIKPQSEFLN